MATAISGTRRAFKELVDGTIRVQIDVDPESRRDFLRLFPDIDTRVAIAPLKVKPEPVADERKGGALAKLAGILCSDPAFQAWMKVDSEESAAQAVRTMCGVESRADLDHDAHAAECFHELIRKPWLEVSK